MAGVIPEQPTFNGNKTITGTLTVQDRAAVGAQATLPTQGIANFERSYASALTGQAVGVGIYYTAESDNIGADIIGTQIRSRTKASTAYPSSLSIYGMDIDGENYGDIGPGQVAVISGVNSGARHVGTGTAWLISFDSFTYLNNAAATAQIAYAINGFINCQAGTVTTGHTLNAQRPQNNGTITTQVGVFIDDQTPVGNAAGTTWQLYSAGASPSLLAGPLQLPAGTSGAPSLTFSAETTLGLYRPSAGLLGVAGNAQITGTLTVQGATLDVANDSGSVRLGASQDVVLVREVAGITSFRNGTNAQSARIYKTYTDGSNWERLNVGSLFGAYYIYPEASGSGSVRTLQIGDPATQGAVNLLTSGNIKIAGRYVEMGDLGAGAAPTANTLNVVPGNWSSGFSTERGLFWVYGNSPTIAASPTNQRWNAFFKSTPAASSARTITNSATVYIEAAAVAGANVTITNNYALWVDDGDVRIDSAIALGGGAAPTLGTIGGSGPAAAAQNEWLRIVTQNGVRFIPLWA